MRAGPDIAPHSALHSAVSLNIARSVADGSRPHHLLVGQSGAGKSHFVRSVLRQLTFAGQPINDAGNPQEGAQAEVLVLQTNEDAYAIGTLGDLLVEAVRTQGDAIAAKAVMLRAQRDLIGLEQLIIDIAGDRPIVLVIENLDRIFDAIGQPGQGSLRAWIETSAQVMVLATATSLTPPLRSRNHPWFGAFNVHNLPPFTAPEVTKYVSGRAISDDRREIAARLKTSAAQRDMQTIYDTIGGTPRHWQILAEQFIRSTGSTDPSTSIEVLLDALTPWLAPPVIALAGVPRRIVVELARHNTAQTVTDLATSLGMSNQNVAAALGRLIRQGWVKRGKPDDGDQRTTLYWIADPVLRLHLRYRDGLTIIEPSSEPANSIGNRVTERRQRPRRP